MAEPKPLPTPELEAIRQRDRAVEDAGWISQAHRDRHKLLSHIEALEAELLARELSEEIASGPLAPVAADALRDLENLACGEDMLEYLRRYAETKRSKSAPRSSAGGESA